MSSIKRQWIARLLALAGELETAGTFRRVARTTDLFVQAQKLPELQIVIGAESPAPEGEDFQGYELEVPVDLKICADPGKRDMYDRCDELVEAVQAKIESDAQLATLVNLLVYEGEQPFTNEVNQPLAGSILFYRVKYRRQRARPEIKY